MGEFRDLTKREMLEALPPVDRAPVLADLARLGFDRFREAHAIPTRLVDGTQLVDHEGLLEDISKFVDPDYKWKAPFFDAHHLYWYANRYDTELSAEFRDLAINKLWIPRQAHNLIHLMTFPSDVPDVPVMKSEVKQFRRRSYMYRVANEAIRLQERIENSELMTSSDGYSLYVDLKTRRAIPSLDAYERRREDLISYIEKAHARGLIDLSQLTTLDLTDPLAFPEALPDIRDYLDQGLARAKGRVVGLAVDLSYQKAA